MKGISRIAAVKGTIVGVLLVFSTDGFAQTVDPVLVPFGTASAAFGCATRTPPVPLERTIRGFFDFNSKCVFGTPPFSAIFSFANFSAGITKFSDEAKASVDQVPIPSGSVSVAYTFDPKLETFVRWERPFAPALSLNARTDGRNVVTIGAAYSYVDYKKFNGQDREDVVFENDSGFTDNQGRPLVDETLFDFRLRQSIYTVALSYGVLDNFDVGVLIPVFSESFRGAVADRFFLKNPDGTFQPAGVSVGANGRFTAAGGDPALPPVRKIDRNAFDNSLQRRTINGSPAPNVPFPLFFFNKNTSGIGDVVFRSKAFFGSSGAVDFGGALNVAVPTGDEDDLLGVGSVRFDPRLLISTATSRFALHTNQGIHVDADESDRDRYDYSVGGEVLVVPWMTVLLDQVGRIEFSGGDKIKKFDIVPGVKINPYQNFVVGFNAIVPLNDEGLRTDFTPNASVEVSMAF